MTFVDPDTGIVITCSPWEYEELRKRYIKIKNTSRRTGIKNGKFKITKEIDDYLDEPCVEEIE